MNRKRPEEYPDPERVKELHDQGLPLATIARRLGIGVGFIRKALRKMEPKESE